ncbi:hypothetical protein [Novosphingobium sp.]|uniref:hypothetical protein n=1 Tax=Novosphingobium sp. TaxID=1874826 RepID=UPI003BA92967
MSTPIRRQRIVLASTIALACASWILLNAAIIALSRGFLPFDRPALMRMPFAWQIAMPSLGLIEQLALMGLVAALCRGRSVAPREALIPERATALREAGAVLAYAMLAQGLGWWLAPLLGSRPFSFHLAGTLVGCSVPPTPHEALVWAAYNGVVYAVLPGLWFVRRYGAAGLWLRFDAGGRDLRVLVSVLMVEAAVQIAAMPAILQTPPALWLKAGPVALVLYGVGTVLPTMITVYAILVPRYWRITGSRAAATILGGLTYAALHLIEGWSNFDSPRDAVLSLLFVMLSYTGPGMFKSYVTLRTGNAWVHALGYHAVAPHVLFDTPLVARIFAIS